MDTSLTDCINFLFFLSVPVHKNSVLLLEANHCHGEVITGYIPYFQKLGFKVDVIISKEIQQERPFCRHQLKNTKIFHFDYVMFGQTLKLKKILRYKHVFLMSSARYRRSGNELYTSVLRDFSCLKKLPSLFVVEHDLVDINRFQEEDLLQKNHLITLGHFDKGVFMCPLLFGDLKKYPKNDVTTFITVGVIDTVRKNHQALIQAIQQLASENLKFKVIIIGKGTLDNMPETVRPYIQIMGRLDFPKMFDCLEKADFFLPLLDPENPEHNRYITSGVTGSAQLIYAFSKVPVLHPKFANFYGFNDDNAILTEDLAKGMRNAIQMPPEQYTQKQQSLTDLAKQLETETFNNLKEILK